MDRRFEHFIKENMHMADKYMKKSLSLVARKMQIKSLEKKP